MKLKSSMNNALKNAFVFGKPVGITKTRVKYKEDKYPERNIVGAILLDSGREANRLYALSQNKK